MADGFPLTLAPQLPGWQVEGLNKKGCERVLAAFSVFELPGNRQLPGLLLSRSYGMLYVMINSAWSLEAFPLRNFIKSA